MKAEQQVEAEQQLNQSILKITSIIRSQFPELLKYLEEMPVAILDSKTSEVTSRNLQTYYESLKVLVKEYGETHTAL